MAKIYAVPCVDSEVTSLDKTMRLLLDMRLKTDTTEPAAGVGRSLTPAQVSLMVEQKIIQKERSWYEVPVL